MTRIGVCLGLGMAASQLLLCDQQIRFGSRYFLQADDSLVHGAEIVAGYLEDDDFVTAVAGHPIERDIFTFEVLRTAIETRFPTEATQIVANFVRMIGFDALVGNQDRHLYNWGIVVHPTAKRPPEFSPIFDTARGLFWNESEDRLSRFDDSAVLKKYIDGARPLIGCDSAKDPNHFTVVLAIATNDDSLRDVLRSIVSSEKLNYIEQMVDADFGNLLSKKRRSLIKKCLGARFDAFAESVGA